MSICLQNENHPLFIPSVDWSDLRLVSPDQDAGGHAFQAALLAAHSPFWQRVLADASGSKEEPILILLPPELCPNTISALLTFLSCGRVVVRGRKAVERLCAAWGQVVPDLVLRRTGTIKDKNDEQVVVLFEVQGGSDETSEEENGQRCWPQDLDGLGPTHCQNVGEAEKNSSTLQAQAIRPKEPAAKFHSCPECNRCFRYAKDLRKHALVHSGELPHGCSECLKYFRNKSNLYNHLRKIHKIVGRREHMQRHVLDAAGRPESELAQTRARQVDAGRLVHEARRVGVDHLGQQLFECSVCRRAFRLKVLQVHVNTHTGVRPYPCGRCDKAFFSDAALRKHERQEHPQSEEDVDGDAKNTLTANSNSAQPGEIQVTQEGRRRRHRPPHQCDSCQKTFRFRGNLLAHQKSAHSVFLAAKSTQPQPCPHCDQAFPGKSELFKHKLSSHADVAVSVCSVCGKRFANRPRLLRHEATHAQRERRLQCAYCPKAYFRSDVLKRHERIHTDPATCKRCHKKFAVDRELQSHLARVHRHQNENELCSEQLQSFNVC